MSIWVCVCVCVCAHTSASWMIKCLLCSSENTDRTYSPGLPWLSRTRKSPCCRSSSCASVRGMAPWYHSCSVRGRSDVGITSKNCYEAETQFRTLDQLLSGGGTSTISAAHPNAGISWICEVVQPGPLGGTDTEVEEPSTDLGERIIPAREWRNVSKRDVFSFVLS